MRVRTLEIRWHDSRPIATCDFQPQAFKKARPAHERAYPAQTYRLATGGEDNHVRVSVAFVWHGGAHQPRSTRRGGVLACAGPAVAAATSFSEAMPARTAWERAAVARLARAPSTAAFPACRVLPTLDSTLLTSARASQLWLVHPNILPPAVAAASASASEPAPAPRPPRVEYVATLSRHSAAVNVVRFSPNGTRVRAVCQAAR
jgi:hypothetical protein